MKLVDKNYADGTVTISLEHFNELENDSFMLQCLQNAGVDNWAGYDYAMEEYRNGNEE